MSYRSISRLNLNPDPMTLKSFGPLAYVSASERQEMLNLPSGDFKPRVQALEKEIQEAKKLQKERLALQRASEARTVRGGAFYEARA